MHASLTSGRLLTRSCTKDYGLPCWRWGIRDTSSTRGEIYRKQRAKVRVAVVSRGFRIRRGVREGCVLSPYLFNILAEMVMREALDGFEGGLHLRGRRVTNLRYADDIILLPCSEAELLKLVNRLDVVSKNTVC